MAQKGSTMAKFKQDPAARIDPVRTIVSGRTVRGFSAILLPMRKDGRVDWDGFEAHLLRTLDAGLIPAVNMDTGYINYLDEDVKESALNRTALLCGPGGFLAGAFVGDKPGDRWSLSAYRCQIAPIVERGGIPVIFQSYGLTALKPARIADAYARIARHCERFVAFELGKQFAPFGAIYDLPTFTEIMRVPECIGAKHSSLSRTLEWQRLAARNEIRPDFMVLTGNDLAIDMVMYGSDYLLGLSTFAPDLFGLRDRLWQERNADFYELNDLLQYLGCFAFREPVPAYKHSAAQTLKLQGWIKCDEPWPGSPRRPSSDRYVLREIVKRLDAWREWYRAT
jgi:dihydrodipicolinate synthase/N-acetylneuraminate lyase